MWSNSRPAFTLIEVLVAVAILGFVAIGSLRLSIIATKNLEEVKIQSSFIDKVQLLETEILTGSEPDNGEDRGLRWRSRKYSYPLMGGLWEVNFRKLDVTQKDGRTMILYIP